MGNQLIGVFDSGVGGLSVLREIQSLISDHPTLYIADQAHVPYGSRKKEEILKFAKGISAYLLDQGAELIVVACNTASAAAIEELRKTYRQVEFVGMEPAVKPAAEHSQSGVVGVLATPSTFESDLFSSVVARFGQDAQILKDTCAGLVEEIEAGRALGKKSQTILESALNPMLEQGLDSVVLGCTHYPFAINIIREIVGKDIEVFDPAPAIARRVAYLLGENGFKQELRENHRLITTGNENAFSQWIASEFPNLKASIEQKNWVGKQLS